MFASSKKSSTFASRLLSISFKGLILSDLLVLCPGISVVMNEICFLVVIILKRIKSGYFKLQDHFCKQGNSSEGMGCC